MNRGKKQAVRAPILRDPYCVPLCNARDQAWWKHERECPIRVAADVVRGKRSLMDATAIGVRVEGCVV